MLIKKIPETDSIIVIELNVVETCAVIDAVKEVFTVKRSMWIDDALVLRFDTLGSFEEAWDYLNMIRAAGLA